MKKLEGFLNFDGLRKKFDEELKGFGDERIQAWRARDKVKKKSVKEESFQ